jgi:16S rRNA (guanine527-N7)-methyltransferase
VALKKTELKKYLIEGAENLGLKLNSAQIAQYFAYIEELKKWSRRINLTALKDDKDIVILHFLDSLTALEHIKKDGSLLDIGTGAGFPGLALKIACPELRLTLLEPTGKKVSFLRHIVRTLGLEGVEVINGRAEDKAIIAKTGKIFDCVVSRALSELSTFLMLAAPYVKEDGRIVAMKGPLDGKLDNELKKITDKDFEVVELDVPCSERKATMVIFEEGRH